MTRDEFRRCVALVDAYWPHGGRAWTVEALDAWQALLLDLDAVHVAAAIVALAGDGREWPPPPGLIRRRCMDLTGTVPGADEAWGEVCDQVRRVGWTRGMESWNGGGRQVVEPGWTHPLIGALADRMGWDALCQSTNPMADRAHFLKLWDAAAERARIVEQLPPAAAEALAKRSLELPDMRAKLEP